MPYLPEKIGEVNMQRKAAAVLLCVILLLPGFLHSGSKRSSPDNIILFIGDGMGVSHITAAKITNGSLNLERFKVAGLVEVNAGDELLTDSAASATAMATGHKTYNGAIAVGMGGEALKTVLEYAEERGMSTGLVSTCSVTHATPAAFAAHVDSRKKEAEIAEHMARSGVDVLFGGGWAYFVPQSEPVSRRKDDLDLLAEMEKNMTVVRSYREFKELGDVRRAAALLWERHPPAADKRLPSLAALTGRAIDILSGNRKGFFLVVEGSQIDWAAHDHKADEIILETIDFDEAVGTGLDFAEKNGRTLVIVTADHETGGFAVHDGSTLRREVTESGFTTDGHTAAMVPLFAYGPGSTVFAGIIDNTDIGKLIIEYVRGR
jgi:alkaline phosphatase